MVGKLSFEELKNKRGGWDTSLLNGMRVESSHWAPPVRAQEGRVGKGGRTQQGGVE